MGGFPGGKKTSYLGYETQKPIWGNPIPLGFGKPVMKNPNFIPPFPPPGGFGGKSGLVGVLPLFWHHIEQTLNFPINPPDFLLQVKYILSRVNGIRFFKLWEIF